MLSSDVLRGAAPPCKTRAYGYPFGWRDHEKDKTAGDLTRKARIAHKQDRGILSGLLMLWPEQMANDVVQPRPKLVWGRIQPFVEIPGRPALAEKPIRGIVKSSSREKENRGRLGHIQPLFYSPEGQGGRDPVQGLHDDVENGQLDREVLTKAFHRQRQEMGAVFRGDDVGRQPSLIQDVAQDGAEESVVIGDHDTGQASERRARLEAQGQSTRGATNLDPSRSWDGVRGNLLATAWTVMRRFIRGHCQILSALPRRRVRPANLIGVIVGVLGVYLEPSQDGIPSTLAVSPFPRPLGLGHSLEDLGRRFPGGPEGFK